METATLPRGHELLRQMLADGSLTSQHDAFLDRVRTGERSTYPSILERAGREAAEADLMEWTGSQHMAEFAQGVRPVAEGLSELLGLSNHGRAVVESMAVSYADRHFPLHYGTRGETYRLSFMNYDLRGGCTCAYSDKSTVFAPKMQLGLVAVTLQLGQSEEGMPAAMLGIVLPRHDKDEMSESGFTTVTIPLAGNVSVESSSPYFTREWWLRHCLGLPMESEDLPRSVHSGGLSDYVLGFPGAVGYLATKLPLLGDYLKGYAHQLSGEHVEP